MKISLSMKRTLLICFFAFGALLLNAQKIYFIYLQTETGDQFFIRMDDKLYSSSSSGYLILSKLIDSTYSFKLGFPGKNVDLDFTTTINKKDHGYLIKNFGEKGWGLFDLQSLNVQMSSSSVKGTTQINESNLQVNAFTEMLSKATDDPSLKQNVVFASAAERKPVVIQTVQKEEKKPDVVAIQKEKKPETISQPLDHPEEKKTEVAVVNEKKVDSPGKALAVNSERPYKKSQVTRISGVATTGGFESVFIDEYENGNKDTVRIVIPAETGPIAIEESKPDSLKDNRKSSNNNADTTQAMRVQAQPEVKKEETKKWSLFNLNKDKGKNETSANSEAGTKKEGLKGLWPFNKAKTAETGEPKQCDVIANNDDFLKLRRKMAGKTNDDGMLDEAKKYFREKCFTTEQVKNLSSMFLSSAGKMNFFELAHDYTSDKENFSSLQFELKDPFYIDQFKTKFSN
jgi:hypothetical protein